MKRTILVYGLSLAALISLLKFLEYRLFVRDLSIEFYVGIVAVMFTILVVWVGLKLTRRKPYMFNYRVENLIGLLKILKEGVEIVAEMQEFSYGKFGWIMDPDGNKIELWEPKDDGFWNSFVQ